MIKKSKLTQALFKTVSYPILGNLSDPLKERLEDKFGEKWFNSDSATSLTFVTNIPLYIYVGHALGPHSGIGAGAGAFFAALFGGIEALYRLGVAIDPEYDSDFPGNLVGVVASGIIKAGCSINSKINSTKIRKLS